MKRFIEKLPSAEKLTQPQSWVNFNLFRIVQQIQCLFNFMPWNMPWNRVQMRKLLLEGTEVIHCYSKTGCRTAVNDNYSYNHLWKKGTRWGQAGWIENRTCVLGTDFIVCVCACTRGSWLDMEMDEFMRTRVLLKKKKTIWWGLWFILLFPFPYSFSTGFGSCFVCNMMHFGVKQAQSFNMMTANRLEGKAETWHDWLISLNIGCL